LRLIHERSDGVLQLVDVIVSHVGSPTTAAQRQEAHAWLERQLPTMEKAVTGLRPPMLTKS
jgi:hypothetical protein